MFHDQAGSCCNLSEPYPKPHRKSGIILWNKSGPQISGLLHNKMHVLFSAYKTCANTECDPVLYTLDFSEIGHDVWGSFLPALCVHVQRSAPLHCIYYRPSSILVHRWDPAPKPHLHTPHTAQCQKNWENADMMDGYIHYIPYLREADEKQNRVRGVTTLRKYCHYPDAETFIVAIISLTGEVWFFTH